MADWILGWLSVVWDGSRSWCGWLRWKIRGKSHDMWVHMDIWSLSCLWLVLQAVRYGSLKLRGKVRDMSVSFCPLGLYKSSLICYPHQGPLNTRGHPWHSSSLLTEPPRGYTLLVPPISAQLGGSQAEWWKDLLLKVWPVDQQHHLAKARHSESQIHQIYWIRVCILTASVHDWCTALVWTLALIFISCVGVDYLTFLYLSFFSIKRG